jgi:hypothetical protein
MTVYIDKDGLKLWKQKKCENNVELLLFEAWNLLDGYMGKELSLLWTLQDGLKHSKCMSLIQNDIFISILLSYLMYMFNIVAFSRWLGLLHQSNIGRVNYLFYTIFIKIMF